MLIYSNTQLVPAQVFLRNLFKDTFESQEITLLTVHLNHERDRAAAFYVKMIIPLLIFPFLRQYIDVNNAVTLIPSFGTICA